MRRVGRPRENNLKKAALRAAALQEQAVLNGLGFVVLFACNYGRISILILRMPFLGLSSDEYLGKEIGYLT